VVHDACKACKRLTVLQRLIQPVLAVLVALTLSGCASTPPPLEQLAAARAMVVQAQSVAAAEGAPELKSAQVKLAQAEGAMQRFEYRDARIFAEQAEVDARYAWTAGESARMRQAANQIDGRRP